MGHSSYSSQHGTSLSDVQLGNICSEPTVPREGRGPFCPNGISNLEHTSLFSTLRAAFLVSAVSCYSRAGILQELLKCTPSSGLEAWPCGQGQLHSTWWKTLEWKEVRQTTWFTREIDILMWGAVASRAANSKDIVLPLEALATWKDLTSWIWRPLSFQDRLL